MFDSYWSDHTRPERSSELSESPTQSFLLQKSWLFSAPFIYVTLCNHLVSCYDPRTLPLGSYSEMITRDRGTWWATSPWGRKESDRTKWPNTHSHGFCSLHSLSLFFLTTSPILDWEECYLPYLSSFSLSRRYIFNVQNILFGLSS